MIKKIVISGSGCGASSSFRWWRLGLTTPINGVWTEKWLVGSNVTVNTTTNYVCDEFKATISTPTYNNTSKGLSSLFTAGTSEFLILKESKPFELSITFTEPITAIKSIIYSYYSSSSAYYIKDVKVYDEGDELLFSSNAQWIASTNATNTTVNYLATPDLETTKIYPTNKVGTVETTDACHITDIYSIDIINPTDVVIDNTDIRYLLSFDGRQTYKSYDTTTGAWITVNTTDIMTQGMTSSELLALTSSEYLLAIDTSYRTLDILVGLITTDETRTPCVNSVRVSYYKITT